MVQNVFEFLKFLTFLFEFIDLSFVWINCSVSLLNNLHLLLNLSLELLIRCLQAFDFVLVFSLLLHILFFFLLLLRNFLFGNWYLTLRSKRSLCEFLDLFGILTFNFFHFFVFLLVYLFHCLFVLLLKPLYRLDCILFSLFFILYFFEVIFLVFSQLLLVFTLVTYDFFLKQLWFLFLRTLELIIFCTFLHDILCLIWIILLQTILKLLFFRTYFFIKLFFHQIFLFENGIILLIELSLIARILILELLNMIIFDWPRCCSTFKFSFFLFEVLYLSF